MCTCTGYQDTQMLRVYFFKDKIEIGIRKNKEICKGIEI
jgi:hypothetical protein